MLAVHGLRHDLCDRCLSRSSCTTKEVGMLGAAGPDLILQSLYDMILAFDLFKCLRPRFTVQSNIGHRSISEADTHELGKLYSLIIRIDHLELSGTCLERYLNDLVINRSYHVAVFFINDKL